MRVWFGAHNIQIVIDPEGPKEPALFDGSRRKGKTSRASFFST